MSVVSKINGKGTDDIANYNGVLLSNINNINGLDITPQIVTTDLVAWYDATNLSSYPGSGSVWYDLSVNNNPLTIYGATFSTNKFILDGINDYFGSSTITGSPYDVGNQPWSQEYWISINATSTPAIMDTRTINSTPSITDYVTGGLGYNLYVPFRVYGMTNPGAFTQNTFQQFVVTYDNRVSRWYVNGVYQGQVSVSLNITTSTSNLLIGRNRPGSYSKIDLGIHRFYKNKRLTDAEVLQNFNAQKSNYGL